MVANNKHFASTAPSPGVYVARIWPDGSKVIAGMTDHFLKVWDAEGQLLNTIKYTQPIYDLAISRDGSKIIILGSNNVIDIMDFNSNLNVEAFVLNSNIKHSWNLSSDLNVKAFVLTPNADKLIFISSDGLKVQKLENWEQKGTPERFGDSQGSIKDVAISFDGKYLVSTSGNQVVIWNIEKEKETEITLT